MFPESNYTFSKLSYASASADCWWTAFSPCATMPTNLPLAAPILVVALLALEEDKMAYDLRGLANRVTEQVRSAPHLSLNDIAIRVNVGRHTIEKAIKQTTGKTFRDLRSQVLLEEAINLLDSDPTQSVKEVAFKLGYGWQRSLSRFIKARVGCCPKELRGKNSQAP
ncbi:MAG TPA: helix-turn-helix domain-containing protein [Candidatus Angelobacter sp.]